MNTIAFFVGTRAPERIERDLGAMLGAIPAWPHERLHFRRFPGGAVGVRQGLITLRDARHSPIAEDSAGRLVVAADMRLDNRRELVGELLGPGRDEEVGDAEILAAGYARWGDGIAARLLGDFTFVIWDGRREELLAGRDPFGVRALYHHRCADGGMFFGSTVEGLLALGDVSRRVDRDTVLEYLTESWRRSSSTFFADLRAVRPGHTLALRAGKTTERRYWLPPAGPARVDTREAHAGRFRELLRESVRARLESFAPVMLELSGGLDSSSIVCLADQLRRQGTPLPDLFACSSLFPGLPCDESALIEVVAARIGFPWTSWNGIETNPSALTRPALAMPGLRDVAADGPGPDLTIARERGARVLVSGAGGDELFMSRGVLRDLARRGRWGRLVREAAVYPLADRWGKLRLLADAFAGLLPRLARRRYRSRVRARATPPQWIGPELRRIWPGDSRELPPDAPANYPEAHRYVWSAFTHPTLSWALQRRQHRAFSQGVETRFPLLDRRLVELALTIPFELRLPSGTKRRFQREVLADIIPAEICDRPAQTTFESVAVTQFTSEEKTARVLISGDRWESAPFVDRGSALRMLEKMSSSTHPLVRWQEKASVGRIARLEAWLRRLHGPETKL